MMPLSNCKSIQEEMLSKKTSGRLAGLCFGCFIGYLKLWKKAVMSSDVMIRQLSFLFINSIYFVLQEIY
jgi:hypothetical protein